MATCRNGHPQTDTTSYLNKAGHRVCRACKRARGREKYAREYAAVGDRRTVIHRVDDRRPQQVEICEICRGVVKLADLIWRNELPYHARCLKDAE